MSVASIQENVKEAFYAEKENVYFSGERADFVSRLPVNPNAAILEIGCGSGETGALALAKGKAGRYTGVELSRAAAARAGTRLTEVVIGDIETMDIPWRHETFDGVIFSEVLEHLVEPWAVLRRVAPLVKPGGVILASSPNVSHWHVVRELLLGRFELSDAGVFDRTHMRWFTPSSFRAMFEVCGYEVVDVAPLRAMSWKGRLVSGLTGGRFDHLFTVQICLEARRR